MINATIMINLNCQSFNVRSAILAKIDVSTTPRIINADTITGSASPMNTVATLPSTMTANVVFARS